MPTALDNGRRSRKAFLRAVVARLGGKPIHQSDVQRVAVVATLRPRLRDQAAEIIAKGPPYRAQIARKTGANGRTV